jgi:hypothetical protein
MGFFQKIIDFFLSLFGMKKSTPALPAAQGTGATAPATAAKSSSDDDDDKPIDRKKYAEEKWHETQQFIAQVEAKGPGYLGGLDIKDPIGFYIRQQEFDQHQMDGKSGDAAAQALGYKNRDHFYEVRDYFSAKYSYLGTNDEGQPDVLIKDEFTNAMMQAAMEGMKRKQMAAAMADPTLLQPENGVSVEQWAAASAALAMMAQPATLAQVGELLAKQGLDKPKYDQANTAWQAKMQRDTTGVIATKFGEAFAAQQGQGAGAGEPCTFDKFCEIMAAQACWAEQGLDVNAQLQKVFSINAAEYSKYGSYWSPKMATDIAYTRKYTELDKKYRAKYAGAGGMDDDLSI